MIDLQVHLKKMSVYERWFVCFHGVIITTQSHFHRKKILNQSQNTGYFSKIIYEWVKKQLDF